MFLPSHHHRDPEDIKIDDVQEMLPEYNFYVIPVDMSDVGHAGATRKRVYIVVASKTMTQCICDPKTLYTRVVEHLKSLEQTTPKDYLSADDIEIQLDAMEVARN